MANFNNPSQSFKNVKTNEVAAKSLFDLKLPAINPEAVKESTVKEVNKAVDFVSKHPGGTALGMLAVSVSNALKYAEKTAPARIEADRIARLEAEQARLRSELEAQKIHDFEFPKKEIV